MDKKKTQPAEAKKISILVFCPSDIILSGILKALESDPGLEILNIEKNTIHNFMESIKKLKPEVILFANMEPLPNMREICKAIREIAKVQVKTHLLLMGNIPAHEEIVNLINSGARGYFDLNDPSHQLAEAVHAVQKGEIWLPRDKMSSIMDRIISVVGRDLKEKTLDQLTPTEFAPMLLRAMPVLLAICRSDRPQSNFSLHTSRIIRMDNRSISTSRSEKAVDHS
jgi:DNA-binding NarL/FixJ family response regulator